MAKGAPFESYKHGVVSSFRIYWRGDDELVAEITKRKVTVNHSLDGHEQRMLFDALAKRLFPTEPEGTDA